MRLLPRVLYNINRLRYRVIRPVTVGVRLILEKGQAVLLVKHTYQYDWYLPGGGVKRGETLEGAARREAAEELGAELGMCLPAACGEYGSTSAVMVHRFSGRGELSRRLCVRGIPCYNRSIL